MFYSFYENVVNYTKGLIQNLVSSTPYKGKIEKTLFLVVEHTSFFLLGCVMFLRKNWLYDLSMTWDYEFDWCVYIYYYLYFVRYVVQIVHIDRNDKDSNVFWTHHVMTLVLLGFSAFRYTKMGVIIALSHDISDIFLNAGKVANKIFEVSNDRRHIILSNIFLSFFVVSWTPTRIILNFNILNEIYTHKNLTLQTYIYDVYIDDQILLPMFFLNLVLQIFWQILIVKFIYNLCIGIQPKDEKGIEYKI